MKKIFALVLVAAMLSVPAYGSVMVGTSSVNAKDPVAPGKTIRISASEFQKDGDSQLDSDVVGWRLCNEYFTLTAKKFDKGAALVKEVKINDNEMSVDIVLNDSYDLSKPNGENLVIKDISLKGKKEYKDNSGNVIIAKNATYKYVGIDAIFVGYDTAIAQKLGSGVTYLDGQLVKFAAGDASYDTAVLDTVPDIYIEGRVYDGDKVYVGIDNDVTKEVLMAAPDEADIRFYNIKTSGLATANTIQLTAEEDEFVYKLDGGKLVASGLKWSADDYAFVGKIRSSVSYVVSDVELKSVAATDKPTENPETGANDVVGIAAALALVSLVAAGAVSMKK